MSMKWIFKPLHLVLPIIFLLDIISSNAAKSQQSLWFGTVQVDGKILQGRFEVVKDSIFKSIVFAPYGITPVTFRNVRQKANQLTFQWQINQLPYQCHLVKQNDSLYTGNCLNTGKAAMKLMLRVFTIEDAFLQGDSLHASNTDLQILDRALILLNNGNNWNRSDNRVCDNGPYPYKWSLFCALHQASIDVDSEYRHLRPANQATRQAINEATSEKKYAHLLQDFNNEAVSFDTIAGVINRAKVIIAEKIKIGQ